MFDVGAIIMADLILSGDNALIIGMAAAGLSPQLRPRAILYGMAIAAILRIVFAIIATELLAVPGLLFVGGLLLVWVCLRLYRDILAGIDERAEVALQAVENPSVGYTGAPRRSLTSALISITIADVSMSLDNVLAVAAIAAGNKGLLIFGLVLAIILMACAATLIMKLLTRHHWISWLGLAVLIYVSAEMLFRGAFDANYGIGPMLGLVDGWQMSRGR